MKLLAGLLITCFAGLSLADEIAVNEVRHYQVNKRYEFGIALLELALSKLDKPYKVIGVGDENINEARGEQLVVEGKLDVQFLSTTESRESRLIGIPQPVYRGILGLRLLLVRPEMNAKIRFTSNLNELRQFVGGHGLHWGDLPVYSANNLRVIPVAEYNKIFEMLKRGRFDYFHRGVSEIWGELDIHSEELMIADNVMLFYSHPVYFFVTKKRPELAQDLEKGLGIAVHDGSYRALFDRHYKQAIEKAKLKDRVLIRLKNPAVPKGTPEIDASWWLPAHLDVSG